MTCSYRLSNQIAVVVLAAIWLLKR